MDILLINALPFILAALLALPATQSLFSKQILTWTTTGLMALSFAALVGYFPYIRDGETVTRSLAWMPDLQLNFSFYLDGLSLLFGLVVTGIGTAIFLYTGYYFDEIEEQRRFTMLLLAFTGAMLGLVLSGNLITMFIMWELTSITSFLLIGFKGDKYEAARSGASQALIVTGGGGLALLAGVLLISVATGQLADPRGGFTFIPEFSAVLASDLSAHPWYNAIAILVLLGAFTKSAQFPFHFWLPNGMSAPTPASAFLHSATMVKAGIYLLARLYPTLGQTDLWTYGLVGVGLTTLLVAAFFSLKQRDLKGLLAYTTISTLGGLVALIGLPGYEGFKAAMVGILAHALYKAALFLSVGSIDHCFETRVIDKLGGVAQYMPRVTVIAILSAISMAGVPILFGFVAKEVLIDAFINSAKLSQTAVYGTTFVVYLASSFLVGTALIFIWDVFFRKPSEKLHYHAMSPMSDVGPGMLALGTVSLGLLLSPLIVPLIKPAVPKEFSLYLIPSEATMNAFGVSVAAILSGGLIFFTRQAWLPRFIDLPISGSKVYTFTMTLIDQAGDLLLKTQNGKLRYYLISILGVLAGFMIFSGLLGDLVQSEALFGERFEMRLSLELWLDLMLIILAIMGAFAAIIARRHIMAVLGLSVMGYAIAGLFFIERAPDVAFVQFMVETLSTVLLVIILSRTNTLLQKEAAASLWHSESKVGLPRDIVISVVIGFCVFTFALIALTHAPERGSFTQVHVDNANLDLSVAEIFAPMVRDLEKPVGRLVAQWHIENAEPAGGVPDIVSAILTDFRGMDTLIEIAVFSMAALGILALLSLAYPQLGNTKKEDKEAQEAEDAILPAKEGEQPALAEPALSTPYTRLMASLILPFALLIAAANILYGAKAPGDGFTAGVIGGLAVALLFMVYGYDKAKERLRWFKPWHFLKFGLGLALLNALWPILLGDKAFLGLVKISDFEFAGIKLTTTLIFETAIAVTVFGSVGIMLEYIARPSNTDDFGSYVDIGNEFMDDGHFLAQEYRDPTATEPNPDSVPL